jgi:TonB family protein
VDDESQTVITGFLAPEAPRLPAHGKAVAVAEAGAACLLHGLAVMVLLLLVPPAAPARSPSDDIPPAEAIAVPTRLVFIAPATGPGGGGGGGGGNRQNSPIRRAQGIGRDALTLRTSKPRRTMPNDASLAPDTPSVVLEARSLASGTFEQTGLPEGGVPIGTSTGPGSGGGVGSGRGTGIGSGQGPGFGSGSGGGAGGGVYRPGGRVSAPRLLSHIKPTYTADALDARIQGSVVLEVVVTRDGRAGAIRILRSLDAGLDQQAIAAVREWRFEPGRLAGVNVDVVVTAALDFQIR